MNQAHHRIRWLIFAIALAVTSVAQAQVDVEWSKVLVLQGADRVLQIDDLVIAPAESKITQKPGAVVTVKTEAANVEVDVTNASRFPVPARSLSSNRFLIETPGKYWVEITAIDFAKNIYGRKTLVIEFDGLPGPSPPGPGPEPGPGPSPTPTPDGSSPFAESGLRVAIVYESADPQFTPGQQSIVYGPDFRQFLDSSTVEWRLLDQDTSYTDPSSKWAKALARPRQSLPWVLIGNGTRGYEGPLPQTTEEMRALVSGFLMSSATPAVKSFAIVTMHTQDNCRYCDEFRRVELPKLSGVGFLESYSPPPTTRAIYPTFRVSVGSKQIVLSGYQTADRIREAIRSLSQ